MSASTGRACAPLIECHPNSSTERPTYDELAAHIMFERQGRGGGRSPGPVTLNPPSLETGGPQPHQHQFVLGDDDLLGSFDDEVDTAEGGRYRQADSLEQNNPVPGASDPVMIALPPRPDEISPDYTPPSRSPRRLSFPYLSTGPGSPPLVSDVGGEIIFHPARPETRSRRQERASSSSLNHRGVAPFRSIADESPEDEGLTLPQPLGNAHAKLLSSLATTKKIASKWKTVLEPSESSSIAHIGPRTAPSLTAELIDVTHTTPFQSNGSYSAGYMAPSGAPGFRPEASGAIHRPSDASGHIVRPVKLAARQEGTQPVLAADEAREARITCV